MAAMLDCSITPGMLAVIVVVVVASMVLAYFIGTACVRAWINKSPTYVYCARCSQFLGYRNFGRPPHLVPGFQVPPYNRINHNDFHDVPNIRVNVSEHDDDPPTGTFLRLGMRTSKSNRSSTFPNFLSPIQASPPDKITTTSQIELLTRVPEVHLSKYVNQPGAVLNKPSSPNNPSSAARVGSLLKKTQQSSGKAGTPAAGASGRSVLTVNTEMLSKVGTDTACVSGDVDTGCVSGDVDTGCVSGDVDTGCVSGDDSVFYQEEEGGCRHPREVSKMSQNPPTTEDSCGIGGDFSGEDQNYLNRDSISNNGDSRKNALVQEKSPNRLGIDAQEDQAINHSFIQEWDVLKTDFLDYPNELRSNNEIAVGGNKITESEAKKVAKRGSPGNTGSNSIPHLDIDYSPLPMSPELAGDHCKAGSCSSHESNDVLLQNEMFKDGHVMKNAAPTGQDLGTKPKIRSSSSARKEKAQYLGKRPGFTESDITSQREDERPRSRIASLRRSHLAGMSQSEEDEATSRKERLDLETPSHTPQYPVQTSKYVTTKRGAPTPSSLPMCTPKFVTVRERNNAPNTSNYPPFKDERIMKNAAHTVQDLGTKPKIRSSSSARKEKVQYLGKRPGFTESDITSLREDERPRSRIALLRRSHLAGMSQSKGDEATSRKERLDLETPSHTPQYPVQTSKYVTTKRGTPTPSSLPMCTPKFVTVRERNNAPDTSNYPPFKDECVMKNAAPTVQDLGTKPKIRSSSSARKEKAQYLGKRPGFTESDITSQREDERPQSRIASLRRSHLAGMSQSEWDEATSRKERLDLETPSHNPQYPVQTCKYVTTKRGTPTPSSLPMCTPKFVTVRERNNAPNISNYPPNSCDSKMFSNFPPNSWDPASQDFVKNKPLNPSASSGQVNLSINSCINNLSVTAMDNSTPAEGNHTNSPHSSAHHASFKPEDLSIPCLDASLSLQQLLNQDGSMRDRPAHTESSSPLVQDGKYSNPMKQPVTLTNSTQNQLPQVISPDIYNRNSHGFLGKDAEKDGSSNSPNKLASKNDARYPTEMLSNLDSSVSSQNQLLKLNHDSSKGSEDTSRGVSLDSTSTLVPSPVNPNNRPQPEAFTSGTPVVSKSSPSPQHSLIPRPIERNHQLRSVPPVGQWSRFQEHALPPSLPPLAPKTRIDVVVPGNTPDGYLQSPAENMRENRTHITNIPIQNVRFMPPAPQLSGGKEHPVPPSLPPPASEMRIFRTGMTNNSPVNLKPTTTNTSSNNVTDSSLDMIKQNFQPEALLQQMRSMPPSSHWSGIKEHTIPPPLSPSPDLLLQQMRWKPPSPHLTRVMEHALPPSLPPSPDALLQQMQSKPPSPQWARVKEHASLPPSPDAFLQQMQSMPPVPQWSRVKEHTLPLSLPPSPDALLQQMRSKPPSPHLSIVMEHTLPLSLPPSPDTLLQQMQSMPPALHWSRVMEHALPPSLPPSPDTLLQQIQSKPPSPHLSRVMEHALPPSLPSIAPKTRISGFGIQRDFDNYALNRRMGVVSDIGRKDSRNFSASGVPRSGGNSGQDDNGDRRSPLVGMPVRSMILQPSRSQSVAGQPNSQVQSRSRSTTESSHPPSLMWDSYGSEPSFVPRRPEDFEDFTLNSERTAYVRLALSGKACL